MEVFGFLLHISYGASSLALLLSEYLSGPNTLSWPAWLLLLLGGGFKVKEMRFAITLILFFLHLTLAGQSLPETSRSKRAILKNTPQLEKELSAKALKLGAPIFIRIFKEEMELEVWVQKDQKFQLFKSYEICYYSGGLGTKTKQGDGKSPEGFYFINRDRLNPWSSYHLSFNLGYPNAYERAKGYTGNYLMIHGACVSIGCYAMTDEVIEALYTLGHKALENGQAFFRVHIFPFRMTDQNMNRYRNHSSVDFWKNLKAGYDWFEKKRVPPNVVVRSGEYVFKRTLE